MTTIVGGTRHRLIKQSLYNMIQQSLTDLGWFQAGRVPFPVSFRSTPIQTDEEVDLNTGVLSTENWDESGSELGSNFGEFSWVAYVDFYAESDSVGQHFIGDIYEIIAGRMSSIGRGRTSFPVYDLRQATPPVAFYCDLEEPMIDRAHDFIKPYQRHWFACRFLIRDAYGDETGS